MFRTGRASGKVDRMCQYD
uniref:Uncharacterized protein n=1 Tax=Anguilla anguilla TaxID=7936 RepID=A0A0E9Q495_ANGAN